MKVKLTYFRLYGKLYSSHEYEFAAADDDRPLFEIWDHVESLRDQKKLPGLREGHGDYIVLVNVPDHPHAHPVLILPGEMDALGIQIEERNVPRLPS